MMTTTYEVWDTGSGNRIGEFAGKSEAIGLICDMLAESGHDGVKSLSLLRIGEDDKPVLVADGAEIAARAPLHS